MHDAPDRAEQADVGTDRTDCREKREMSLEPGHFILMDGTHHPPDPVPLRGAQHAVRAFALPGEFAEPGFKNAFRAGAADFCGRDRAVERLEIRRALERLLEFVGLMDRLPE